MGFDTRKFEKTITAGLLLSCALLVSGKTALARERKVLQKTTSAPADPQNRAADAWIDQTAGSTGANHGGDTTLRVTSFNPGTTQNQRALVLFDLSSIPGAGVKLATLSLFMSTAPGVSRNYQARRITSLWSESAVSWSNRLSGTAWGVAGGDVSGAVSATTASGTTSGVSLNWTITTDVRRYFGAATPSGSYGTLIRDATENSGTARTAVFSSKEDPTEANRPKLTIEYIQNVQGLTTAPGSAQITLSWSYPPAVGTVLSATVGVLILRQANGPIAANVVPTDGTTPTRNAGCTNMVGAATVVFNSNTLPTTFNDSAAGNNPDCPPVNGTLYYYKVFTRDAANAYSQNGATSNFVPMATATPSATPSLRQGDLWLSPTGSTTLAAPGIIPSKVVAIGSSSRVINGVKPSDGTPVFAPVSTGGTISGRPTVLEGLDASIGRDVTYSANNDGFVYAIDSATGDILWMANPTGLTTNGFTGGASVVVKSFSGLAYTLTSDLVVVGTRNAGSTTTNRIVGIDGNTGATLWQLIGNSGGNPPMDIVASTPFIDFTNNTLWVTSHSAGGAAQPSLWKINPNTGLRLATANLGNITGSPVVTVAANALFVGNDAGVLFAINPVTAGTLASFNGGNTVVTGSPVMLNFASPYTVIFSGATTVKAVIFDSSTNTFTTTGPGTWSTTTPAGCTPSAPLGFPGFPKIYIGCSDGHLYQLDALTGAIDGNRTLDPNTTIGDPALDVELSRIIAGSTDSRVYAFTFPF